VLKRLDDALADGDAIYGVIRGAAINNDGGDKASFTAPSVEGQATVIAMALADAGVEARDIDYVEAHGTATPLGDPIELDGLTTAFRKTTSERGFCGIGSIKSNLGHLVIAAGASAVAEHHAHRALQLLADRLADEDSTGDILGFVETTDASQRGGEIAGEQRPRRGADDDLLEHADRLAVGAAGEERLPEQPLHPVAVALGDAGASDQAHRPARAAQRTARIAVAELPAGESSERTPGGGRRDHDQS